MANVRQLRHRVKIAAGLLIGINVLALSALVFLSVYGTSSLAASFDTLHRQVQRRKELVVSPQMVNARIQQAREQIAHFREDRFPDSSAAVFEQLGKIATENRVHLSQANYKLQDTEIDGVRQMTITATLDGDYTQEMKFINALERDKIFIIVQNVGLAADQSSEGTNVRLNLQLDSYMRGTA